MIRKAFGMTKRTAYRHNYQPLYDFIAAGFAAMRPLDSVKGFIDPFCARELEIIKKVHASDDSSAASVFTTA